MSDKQRAFKSFYDELVELASKHFDAYICGKKASPMTHKTFNEPPPPTGARPEKNNESDLKKGSHKVPTNI